MKIDIVNMARHASKKELRWFAGEQVPIWIRLMLAAKARGADLAKLIDDFAEVCCVTEETAFERERAVVDALGQKHLFEEEEH